MNTVDREEGIQWTPYAIILVPSSASSIKGPMGKEIEDTGLKTGLRHSVSATYQLCVFKQLLQSL